MDLSQYLDPSTVATLQAGGYFLMLGLMILEGPLVTFAGAFLASFGVFDIWIVFLLGWLGDIFGDLLFYMIGRYGLHIFTKKTTVDTPKEKTFIHKLDHLIHTNLAFAILIIKFTPYAPPIGLTYIGKIKVDIKRYLVYSAALCIPIPLVSTLVGFNLGYFNTIIARYSGFEFVLYFLGAIIVISIALGVIVFLRKKTKNILQKEERFLEESGNNPDLT